MTFNTEYKDLKIGDIVYFQGDRRCANHFYKEGFAIILNIKKSEEWGGVKYTFICQGKKKDFIVNSSWTFHYPAVERICEAK